MSLPSIPTDKAAVLLLIYKGYVGTVHQGVDGFYFYGNIEYIKPCVTYEGNSLAELKASFEAAVDILISQEKEDVVKEPLIGFDLSSW